MFEVIELNPSFKEFHMYNLNFKFLAKQVNVDHFFPMVDRILKFFILLSKEEPRRFAKFNERN
jgi:hypothetical protein